LTKYVIQENSLVDEHELSALMYNSFKYDAFFKLIGLKNTKNYFVPAMLKYSNCMFAIDKSRDRIVGVISIGNSNKVIRSTLITIFCRRFFSFYRCLNPLIFVTSINALFYIYRSKFLSVLPMGSEINWILVEKNYQQMGIGKALIERARSSNGNLWAKTLYGSKGASVFYVALGFVLERKVGKRVIFTERNRA